MIVDALTDVIASINDVYLMPELREGFHNLFTFKYMEIYIYLFTIHLCCQDQSQTLYSFLWFIKCSDLLFVRTCY